MKNITELRIKHTEKLEKLIENNATYNKILKQSQIVDKYIVYEMKRNIKKKELSKVQKIYHKSMNLQLCSCGVFCVQTQNIYKYNTFCCKMMKNITK